MNTFSKLATVLTVPLGLINIFGAIVSDIWLAILGEWGIIGYGIAALFVSGIGLGIAMMPGLLLAAPAAALQEKGKMFGFYMFGFLSALYTIAILTVWCIAILLFFTKQANADSIIPILIWSYGVATAPIAWMAQKEMQGGNEFSMISTFFAQVAYILVIIAILLFRVSLLDVTILFGVVMFFGLLIQFRIASQIERESEYY